jgi:lipopolysaccharide transport system permease protein
MNDWNPCTPVKLLWMRRDLLWQFTKRNVQTGFRGSYLGVFWVVLGPLMMLGLYSFVFGVVFGGGFEGVLDGGERVRLEGVDYALGIFLGLSVLNLVSGSLASCSTLIVSNPNFVKKVVFPLEILPVAQVGNLLFNFMISLLLCLAGLMILGPGLSVTFLWIPFILFPVILIIAGIGWLVSALGVFFRDLAQLTQIIGMILLYASGVFYSVSMVPPNFWQFLRFNPILQVIDQLRRVALWQVEPNLVKIGVLWLVGLFFFQLGYWVFRRLRPDFADVL